MTYLPAVVSLFKRETLILLPFITFFVTSFTVSFIVCYSFRPAASCISHHVLSCAPCFHFLHITCYSSGTLRIKRLREHDVINASCAAEHRLVIQWGALSQSQGGTSTAASLSVGRVDLPLVTFLCQGNPSCLIPLSSGSRESGDTLNMSVSCGLVKDQGRWSSL